MLVVNPIKWAKLKECYQAEAPSLATCGVTYPRSIWKDLVCVLESKEMGT